MTDPVSSTGSPDGTAPESGTEGLPNTSIQNQDASQSDPSPGKETASADAPKAETPEGGKEDEGAKRPKSILEAAKAALAAKDKGAASQAADAKDQQPKPKDGKGEPAAKTTEDEGKAEVPQEFSKHPAWVRIAKQRDEFKAGAERWDRFNELVQSGGYGETKAVEDWLNGGTRLNEAGVSTDERGLLLEFAVAAKTDPKRAWEILDPIHKALRGVLGEDDLPDDLKQAVEAGEMTEDAARRVARSEAASRIEAKRTSIAQERETARNAEQAEGRAHAGMTSAVVGWERRQAASDPDWLHIAEAVSDQVALLRAARNPRTPEDAVKVCDDAVAFVKRLRGQPKPVVAPSRNTPSNTQTVERPKSVFEAAKRALSA
jgi:hypothetical protein